METTTLSGLIRALARGDWDTADAVVADLDRSGWVGGIQIIGAAFAVAVNQRFDAQSTADDVARYVAAARASYQGGETLPALEMEGLVRAALGEPSLADNIVPEVALGIEVFVLGHLLQEFNLDAAQLDEFVAEAEQAAAQIM